MTIFFADSDSTIEPLGLVSGFVNEFVDAVGLHAVFGSLSREETSLLSRHMECYGVPRDTMVLREGDAGDFMAILVTGRAMIIKSFEGVEKVVHDLQPGEMIGEMSLIDGQKRFASCVTTEPSDFAVLSKAKLEIMLEENPQLGNKFLLMLLALTTRRLRHATTFMLPGLMDCSV
jgi:CRP/FNR family transcriptional regulator, cyclic AMP receptor protein